MTTQTLLVPAGSVPDIVEGLRLRAAGLRQESCDQSDANRSLVFEMRADALNDVANELEEAEESQVQP